MLVWIYVEVYIGYFTIFYNLNNKLSNYKFFVFENDPLGFFTLLVGQ